MARFANRRQFTHAAVLAAASTLGLSCLQLGNREAHLAEEAFMLLQTHLGITSRDRPVVRAFTRSVLTTVVHQQPPAALAAMWRDPARRERRDHYLLHEFILSTNYLLVASGRAEELMMLPLDASGRRLNRPKLSRVLS